MVTAVPPGAGATMEPTGAGDAFRAGFLAGLHAGLAHQRAAMLGCAIATTSLETAGPQDYQVKPADLEQRLAGAYGHDVADRILAALALEA